MSQVLIFLPTLNERENIRDVLERLLALTTHPILKGIGIDRLRILVVDDGSTDGTIAEIREIAGAHPGSAELIVRNERGRGSARLVGFEYGVKADVDYLVEMDADLSHAPEEVPDLLAAMLEADLVLGSRYCPGADRRLEGGRALITHLGRIYFRLMVCHRVHDWSNGFRSYNRRALELLTTTPLFCARHLRKSYALGAEVIFTILYEGLRVKEVPISFADRSRGRSKWSPIKESVAELIIGVVLRLRMLRRGRLIL